MNFTVDQAIYQKFYESAQQSGVVWLVYDWYAKKNPDASEEEIENFVETFEHAEALQKVLAYEISIFVYRRLNGPWGEIIDFFRNEICSFTNEYREATGYQIEGNDVDYY